MGEGKRIREGGVGLGATTQGGNVGEWQWAKAKKIRMAAQGDFGVVTWGFGGQGWILRWCPSSDRLDWSFYLGLAGFCWGLSCGSCCLGLETVRVDLNFEWSCCLGLETERVVLVGNESENSGSSMKE